ncbi:hypothetical protein T492DRAFT_888926 [Pavlovales sp. CCMP2436]|nr:hypothetical protein T492DRAFT_888926 [Pavlovales sp. CCMP2436]
MLTRAPPLRPRASLGAWPDQVGELARAPSSIDFWVRCFADSSGGVVCGSAPVGGSLTVEVTEEGMAKFTWHALHELPDSSNPSEGGVRAPVFELALQGQLRTGRWTHVAFVYIAKRDVLVGYVGGMPAGEAVRLSGVGSEPLDAPPGPVLYAQDATPVGADGSRWFDGELSHVRFWSSELPPHAIAEHAQGKVVKAAMPLGYGDAKLAAEQRQRRVRQHALLAASAAAERESDSTRRSAEAAAEHARREAFT